MDNRKIFLIVFILVASVQLFVPAKMIWDREEVINTGKEYKFKTAPVDPIDPFRGKFITLSYRGNVVEIENEPEWVSGEQIYAYLTIDEYGFAEIGSVSKFKLDSHQDYIRAMVAHVSEDGSNQLTIDYPFDRFYMKESKAYEAELAYQESQQDTSKVTYALVSIINGEAVLKDVMIDGVSIREIVKSRNQE